MAKDKKEEGKERNKTKVINYILDDPRLELISINFLGSKEDK